MKERDTMLLSGSNNFFRHAKIKMCEHQPHGIQVFCFSFPNELCIECNIIMPAEETTTLPEILKKLYSLASTHLCKSCHNSLQTVTSATAPHGKNIFHLIRQNSNSMFEESNLIFSLETH